LVAGPVALETPAGVIRVDVETAQQMAEAVFAEAAGRLAPAIAAILGSDEPLDRKVEQFVHLYIDTARRHPYIPGYVLAEMHHHPERLSTIVARLAPGAPKPLAQPILARLGAQLDALAADGTIRAQVARLDRGHLQQLGLRAIQIGRFPQQLAQHLARLDVVGPDFQRFLDERRADLPGFILNALRP
jgi:hypothetical protein